jgi:hypothetical protein
MTCLGSVDGFLGPDVGPPRQQVLLHPLLLVSRPLKRGGGGRRPQSGQCKQQQQQFHWAALVRILPGVMVRGGGELAAAPWRDGTGRGGMSCGVCQPAGRVVGGGGLKVPKFVIFQLFDFNYFYGKNCL